MLSLALSNISSRSACAPVSEIVASGSGVESPPNKLHPLRDRIVIRIIIYENFMPRMTPYVFISGALYHILTNNAIKRYETI